MSPEVAAASSDVTSRHADDLDPTISAADVSGGNHVIKGSTKSSDILVTKGATITKSIQSHVTKLPDSRHVTKDNDDVDSSQNETPIVFRENPTTRQDVLSSVKKSKTAEVGVDSVRTSPASQIEDGDGPKVFSQTKEYEFISESGTSLSDDADDLKMTTRVASSVKPGEVTSQSVTSDDTDDDTPDTSYDREVSTPIFFPCHCSYERSECERFKFQNYLKINFCGPITMAYF